MNFTLQVPIAKSEININHQSDLLLLGSCFSENIGSKFSYFKFNAHVNPFGIIFNICSIEKLIYRAVHQLMFTVNDIFYHNDRWHSYEVHSSLSNSNKEDFLQTLNNRVLSLHEKLTTVSHILITLGTSWAYQKSGTSSIVANCHKMPQKTFVKQLISQTQTTTALRNIIKLIKKINPACQLIFTVSPVRHIKDGFFENNVSKGILFSALQEILDTHTNVFYFPSYEIVLDELRDYRFFEKDMLHPNSLAIDYIWERLGQTYFNQETINLLNEIDKLEKAKAHKPFNPNTEAYQKFLQKIAVQSHLLQQKINKTSL